MIDSGSDSPKTSKVIGQRYEVVRQLREEPWGEVWLARDTLLGTEVALKLISRDDPEWPAAQKILEQEAKDAFRLRHPQILGVFHLGETEDGLYLVQEPFPGESLMAMLLRQERFSLGQALHILEQVSAALALAHERHLAHQALNPLQILLKEEEVRVANFAFPPRDDEQLISLELKAYNPPEVIQGEASSPAGNIFSLGVLGFRLVAGSLPYPLTFDEPFPYRLETPPVDLEEVPLAFQNLLLGCLAVEPEERFPHAAAFLSHLKQAREQWRSVPGKKWMPRETGERRPSWPGAAPAMDLLGKIWTHGKAQAEKLREGLPGQVDRIKSLPRRLWLGLGLAGLIVILLIAGLKIGRRVGAPPPPASPPSAVTLPGVGGGPPLVATREVSGVQQPARASQPAARQTPAATLATPGEVKASAREERFMVMVATFADLQHARALSKRLRAKKYQAVIVKKTRRGKSMYQVRIGPVRGRRQADDMARRLKTQEHIVAKVEKLTRRAPASSSRSPGR